MKAVLIFLPIMMTISLIVLTWSSGYGIVFDERMIAPLGVVIIGSLNLLLTIRANLLRRKFSEY